MMENSRKRAAAACDYCRRRKRRCDGEQPTCGFCRKSNTNCVYTNAGLRRSDRASSELNERLNSLEALIEEQAATIEDLKNAQQLPQQQGVNEENEQEQQLSTRQQVLPEPQLNQQHPFSPPFPLTGIVASPFTQNDLRLHQQPDLSASHPTPSLSFDVEAPPMLIPRGHSTTTESLLASEQVKALLGEFPQGMFLVKEVRRGWPTQEFFESRTASNEDLPRLSQSDTQHLVEAYFNLAHREFPVLDRDQFMLLYHRLLEGGLAFEAESALCLVVLAIGSIVAQDSITPALDQDEPGLIYISDALRILVPDAFHSFGSTVASSQALLLAAKYFGYLLRPLQSWKLVSMASTSIQHLCSVAFGPNDDFQHAAKISLTAWSVFDAECDLIAEHQLPHSGIEHVIESMPFPTFDDDSDATIFFLAELSVRKLLNRVHHTLYDNASPTFLLKPAADSSENQLFNKHPVSQVLSISRELDRQLETWFRMLPSSIRPDLSAPETWKFYQLSILQRYHSAKDIIFRPFVMYACSLPPKQHLPSLLLEHCESCITNCRSYIYSSAKRLELMCAHREIILHSVLASTVILTLAALSPKLKLLVLDIDAVQTESIKIVNRWSTAGSLVEDIAEIIRLLRTKTRLLKPQRYPLLS